MFDEYGERPPIEIFCELDLEICGVANRSFGTILKVLREAYGS
jgi:hypothetical protein